MPRVYPLPPPLLRTAPQPPPAAPPSPVLRTAGHHLPVVPSQAGRGTSLGADVGCQVMDCRGGPEQGQAWPPL